MYMDIYIYMSYVLVDSITLGTTDISFDNFRAVQIYSMFFCASV
jgi:hypothetical protein